MNIVQKKLMKFQQEFREVVPEEFLDIFQKLFLEESLGKSLEVPHKKRHKPFGGMNFQDDYLAEFLDEI